VRGRKVWFSVVGASGLTWALTSTVALAAQKAAKAQAPSFFDQIVNVISDLINWVAGYVGHDYGIALIIVTLLIRLLTMPLMLKSLRNTKRMQALQPQMAEIKAQYGKDPKQQQEKVMELYKQEGVNPFAGCMPMILQMVVLMILYRGILTDQLMLHSSFLGLDLGKSDPTYILPVLAGLTSFLQQKVSMVQTDSSQKMLLYIFPVMIFFLATRYLAAMALYWVFSNVFTIVQMYLIRRQPTKAGA